MPGPNLNIEQRRAELEQAAKMVWSIKNVRTLALPELSASGLIYCRLLTFAADNLERSLASHCFSRLTGQCMSASCVTVSSSYAWTQAVGFDINLKMYQRRNRTLFDYGWLDEVAINRGNSGGGKAGSIRFNPNTRPLMRGGWDETQSNSFTAR